MRMCVKVAEALEYCIVQSKSSVFMKRHKYLLFPGSLLICTSVALLGLYLPSIINKRETKSCSSIKEGYLAHLQIQSSMVDFHME